MIESVSIRSANPQEAIFLSALAMRSKAHWGYPVDFIEACREELSMTADDIKQEGRYYVVAEILNDVVGFYALTTESSTAMELDALFVEPSNIGFGVGRALMNHAKDRAKKLGAEILSIQSDPHAEKFYRAMGAVHTGEKESGSIQGRFLPMFNISLLNIPDKADS